MRFSSALLLALLSACREAPPVARAQPVPVAAVAAPDAGPSDLSVRAEAALQRGALDEAVGLWEQAALGTVEPSEPLFQAARARRIRVETELARAASAAEPADALAEVARDAKACAADAHRSWAAQFPVAAAQLDGTHPAAEIYAQVGEPAAPALYLEAVCSAAWARSQGFTQLVERRTELQEAFKRVARLSPDLDDAGAERELGKLLAALPTYAGGDLSEARRHLDAALARAPKSARNHLAIARSVAVKSQDRALFEKELHAATDSDDRGAQAEAVDLLAHEDDFFGPAESPR